MTRTKAGIVFFVCILLAACTYPFQSPPTPTQVVEIPPTSAPPETEQSLSSDSTPLPPATPTDVTVLSVEDTPAYTQLPDIVLSSQWPLGASPAHPNAYPVPDPIPVGTHLRVLGTDSDAAWLLVLDGNRLGWIPGIYSGTGIGSVNAAVVIYPLSVRCTTYLGGSFTAGEAWQANQGGSIAVQSIVYRAQPTGLEDVSVSVEIDGQGQVAAPDLTSAAMPGGGQLFLYTAAVDNLQPGSVIRLQLKGMDNEPFSFQAAYYANSCAGDLAALTEDAPPDPEATAVVGSLPQSPSGGDGTQPPPATPLVIKIRFGPKATATPKPAATASTQVERDLLNVLERYEAIRIKSHGPSHDVSGLDSVLAEGALKSHLQAVRWQHDNNAYYRITVHSKSVEETSVSSAATAEVLMTKLESREFYINGKLGPKNTVYNDNYQVRYFFKRIGGDWYIVDREVITAK